MGGRRKGFVSAPFAVLRKITLPRESGSAATVSPPPPPDPAPDDDELFRQAMAEVDPLVPRRTVGTRKHPPTAGEVKRQKRQEVEREDRREFLEAMSRLKLDVSFSDSIPSGRGGASPSSRRTNRLADLKNGKITIGYELDLHGLSREEALAEIGPFIASARRHGERAVLVITGRGLHSTDGPVLRSAIASWLAHEGRGAVLEFAPAPPELGGDGAFVVFLRKERSRSPQ